MLLQNQFTSKLMFKSHPPHHISKALVLFFLSFWLVMFCGDVGCWFEAALWGAYRYEMPAGN
jgi:hypothetical protein